MKLPKATKIAVADGEKFNFYENTGDEANLSLKLVSQPSVDAEAGKASGRQQASSGNPDAGQAEEDGFSAGIVETLNAQALSGKIDGLVIIAAPRALGEMRKHYHKVLSSKLLGEIAKDLTGHPVADIEKAIEAA